MKLLSLFIVILICSSCSNEEKSKTTPQNKQKKEITGEVVYAKHCKLCHGVDGKLGLSNAADLSISVLSLDEKIDIITNGRKGMTSFKDQLSPEQIKMVAEYLETLHQ